LNLENALSCENDFYLCGLKLLRLFGAKIEEEENEIEI
jgi:hypothetical protein